MKKPLLTIASFILSFSLQAHAQTMAPPTPTPAGPSDAEIAHIVVTANSIDVEAGKFAEKKAKNKEVKAFARKMVRDHSSSNKQAEALAKKLNVTPKENDTSKSLKKDGDDNMSHLKTLKGKEFDKAYIDHEVAYHETVLDAIDKTLIPSSQNTELKELITKTRPVIAEHLEHAKKIQEMLNK